MKNKFLNTGEAGFHPLRKTKVVISGLGYAVRYDFSVTYKLVLSIFVLAVFFLFRQWVDFLLLTAATVMMLQAELFNSAIEAVCDFLTTKGEPQNKSDQRYFSSRRRFEYLIVVWHFILRELQGNAPDEIAPLFPVECPSETNGSYFMANL